jgi:hypothetical protein
MAKQATAETGAAAVGCHSNQAIDSAAHNASVADAERAAGTPLVTRARLSLSAPLARRVRLSPNAPLVPPPVWPLLRWALLLCLPPWWWIW